MIGGIIDRGSSDRGITLGLFKDIQANLVDDPRRGFFLFDDMFDLNTGAWTGTQATQGTWALDTTVGNIGVGLLDCNSTTDNQGMQIQRSGWAVAPSTGRGVIAMEFRCKAADIATGPQFFGGLSIVDTTLIASGANSSTDHVGFESVTDNNIILFQTEDGGTRVSGATSPHTFVDDTYVKLGFRLYGNTVCDVFVNGVEVDVDFSATPEIPDGSILVPSFVCQSAGTTDPILHIDWLALAYYK